MSRLVLIFASIVSLCFVTACSAMSNKSEKLTGTWILQTLDGQNLEGARAPYIEFLEDGKITGSTGCNRIGGNAIQSEGGIQFRGLISTKRACVEYKVMQQEQQILKALDSVVKLKHEQNMVELLDSQDNVIMTLSKKS